MPQKNNKDLPIDCQDKLNLKFKSNTIFNETRKLIKLTLKPTQKPIVINDMKRIINEKIKQDLRYHAARKIVKDELKYSFK